MNDFGRRIGPSAEPPVRPLSLPSTSVLIVSAGALLVLVLIGIVIASKPDPAPVQTVPGLDGGLLASEVAVAMPSEPTARYRLLHVSRDGDGYAITISSRFSKSTGWAYTGGRYDCAGGRYQVTGSGMTFDTMLKSAPETRWSELATGSAAALVGEIACKTVGQPLALPVESPPLRLKR
jgi:hypothetical protein